MHYYRLSLPGLVGMLGVSAWLASCGTGTAAVPTPSTATSALDPCRPETIVATVKPVNDLTLQFDDYSMIAQNADKAQLVQIIPNMQTIRRVAEGRRVPACLMTLQQHQIAFMDATLDVLLEFQKPDPRTGPVATGIVQAQYYHQEYALELARLLGVTVIPPTPASAVATP